VVYGVNRTAATDVTDERQADITQAQILGARTAFEYDDGKA
jgi:hypothetical protein|tara:strand:- start:339 stop:461 length:123 start_codon:yes stop_codon:yes gene_type:complete